MLRCGQECPLGYYGNNCMELCSCRNGGTCDYRNGKCSCPEGYMVWNIYDIIYKFTFLPVWTDNNKLRIIIC